LFIAHLGGDFFWHNYFCPSPPEKLQ
jgi:hypothetical protein